MKTLRLIGMAIIAEIMSVNFVACDDDEDSDNVSLIGKIRRDKRERRWKAGKKRKHIGRDFHKKRKTGGRDTGYTASWSIG